MDHVHAIPIKADVSRVGENVGEDLQVLQVFRGFLAPHPLSFGTDVTLYQLVDDAPCLNGYRPLPRRLFHRLAQRIKDGRVETATKLSEMKMSRTADLRVRVDDVTQQSGS